MNGIECIDCGAVQTHRVCAPCFENISEAAVVMARNRARLPQHVRSVDGDGEPLHYCSVCFQDWPCGEAKRKDGQ